MQVAARPKVLLLDEPTAGVAQREAEVFGPMLRGIRRKVGRQALKDYVLWPALAGPFFAYVLAANATANVIRCTPTGRGR